MLRTGSAFGAGRCFGMPSTQATLRGIVAPQHRNLDAINGLQPVQGYKPEQARTVT
jgi:hypothetical protein